MKMLQKITIICTCPKGALWPYVPAIMRHHTVGKLGFSQIFGVYEFDGVVETGIQTGIIEIIGGTGECVGIEGTMEMLPRPVTKTSKEGAYQGIGIGKITWKIP